MKKVEFSINGKKYEVELENAFALFVIENLNKHNIDSTKNTTVPKLLNAYLLALKENYDNKKKIEELLVEISI